MTELTSMEAQKIVDALRQGTVPQKGLEHYAVGLDEPMRALRDRLKLCSQGGGSYKFIRGPYGSGKTFLASLVGSEAFDQKFLVSKVVISTKETPLFKPLTVYRSVCKNLLYSGQEGGLTTLIHQWLYELEQQVVDLEGVDEDSPDFLERVGQRIETQLASVEKRSGRLGAVLRAYQRLRFQGRFADAQALLDWLSGDPHVASAARQEAGVKGDLKDEDWKPFLQGLLEVIRFRNAGLVIILDEVETQQGVRSDWRKQGWETLRAWVDAIDQSEFPGLLLIVTGTPELFESSEGLRELEPLHQRIHVDFDDKGPVNYLQAQIPLPAFDNERLLAVGAKVRDIYPAKNRARVTAKISGRYLEALAARLLRDEEGLSPRKFLRTLIDEIDKVDQNETYDP